MTMSKAVVLSATVKEEARRPQSTGTQRKRVSMRPSAGTPLKE